jgi:hypothetical protein
MLKIGDLDQIAYIPSNKTSQVKAKYMQPRQTI